MCFSSLSEGRKCRICLQRRETQVRSLSREDPLAIHSSVLSWRISWTEEPGWLQCMGLQRVGYNWTTNTHKTVLFVLLLRLFQVCPSEVHSGWLLCSFDMPLPFCLSEHFLTSWHCQRLQVYFIFSCGKRTFLTMRRHRRLQFDLWVRRSPGWGMATHSSIIVWRIPWTEKPG